VRHTAVDGDGTTKESPALGPLGDSLEDFR
jgi:hypothetical protein